MYDEHFGLERAPFRITPDTRLFHTGGSRGEVLEALVYAISSGEGIVKVVGEVGTGKTMLCRMLEDKLPDNVEIVYLANPSLSPEDILAAIGLELGIPLDPNASRVSTMHELQRSLVARHANGHRVVVLVEEAQSMPIETLEEIRLLSNLETKQEKLLQIVLFGQPELDENLAERAIRQLNERITHSFYLEPLAKAEVRDYVQFRLRASGYKGRDMFTSSAYSAIASAAQGLTRRVNIIADKALLAAYAENTHDVTRKHVEIAIRDSQFKNRAWVRGWWLVGAISVLLILLVGIWLGAVNNGLPNLWGKDEKSLGQQAEPIAVAPTQSTAGEQQAPSRIVAVKPKEPQEVLAARDTGTQSAKDAALAAPVATVAAAAQSVQQEPLRRGQAPVPAKPQGQSEANGDAAATASPNIVEPNIAKPDVVAKLEPAASVIPEAAPGPVAPETLQPPSIPSDSFVTVENALTLVSAGAWRTSATADAFVDSSRRAADFVLGRVATERADWRALSLPFAPGGRGAEPHQKLAFAWAPGFSYRAAELTKPSGFLLQSIVVPASASAENAMSESVAKRSDAEQAARAKLKTWLQRGGAWLASREPGKFSIQLLATESSQRDKLAEFLENRVRNARAGLDHDLHVYRTLIDDRAWFGVLLGSFQSVAAARAVLEKLPEELRTYAPFIRAIDDIRHVPESRG